MFGIKKETYRDSTYYLWKGKEIGKKLGNCIYIGEWYVGWHTWEPEIVYQECDYEDGNARLVISLFGWLSKFKLPWKSKRFPYGDCDEPRWGIAIHDNVFWIYVGGDGNGGNITRHCKNFIAWDLPFFSQKHVRHQVACHNVHGLSNVCMIDAELMECHDSGNWKPIHKVGIVNIGQNYYELVKYQYDYTDSYDGEKIPCTYWVEEREWRPKWLTWTSLFGYTKRYIEIAFDKEVGKEKGSWKGGCLGCSYELRPGETPQECIQRMEKERKF